MFDLKLNDIAVWIRNGGYSSVALQLPEGLKIRATEIIDYLSEETDSSFIIVGEPCYGACDLFTEYKETADALVHFGHSPIPSQGDDSDVFYVEAYFNGDIREYVNPVVNEFSDNVGLLATIQYINCLPQVKEIFEKAGKNAVIGTGDGRITYPGQVLGCNCSSAENIVDDVDEFLFIGEGDFHPLAAAFGVNKRMRVLNPVTGELRSIDEKRDRILRKRFAAIESARDANDFLVIVCSKVGQNRNALADEMVSKITASGRKAYKVCLKELSPQALLSYKVDAYVSTACPRLAMDDYSRYEKPILTPVELEIVLGIRDWDDYKFDAIRP